MTGEGFFFPHTDIECVLVTMFSTTYNEAPCFSLTVTFFIRNNLRFYGYKHEETFHPACDLLTNGSSMIQLTHLLASVMKS